MEGLVARHTASPLRWVLDNKMVGEGGQPLEFKNHRFLYDIYDDLSPEMAIRKAAQIGFSTLATIRTLHAAHFLNANVIYTLPTKNVVKDFVTPKVNPIIGQNPALAKLIRRTDSVTLKQVGKRFIYFRGSWEEREAITITADILVEDEYDRSNPSVLKVYDSRLAHSLLKWKWRFSNPSIPGIGIDRHWLNSDQKYWIIKCPHCNKQQYLDYPASLDFKKQVFVCKYCHRTLTSEDRSNGEWVARYPDKEVSGYWISQMMCPWITAPEVITESKSDPMYFHNFVLGKPYQSSEVLITRKTFVPRLLAPGKNNLKNVAIGVDNGIVKHYVVGNNEGIFLFGKTESWSDIEMLRNKFNAKMVIDKLPYPSPVEKLCKKYPNRVWAHFFKTIKGPGFVEWGGGDKLSLVYSDRTKAFDYLVSEFNSDPPMVLFNMTEPKMEEYISHWTVLYRTIDKDRAGRFRPMWITQEGKPDHFALATLYWRIAMEKCTGVRGGGLRPPSPKKKEVGPTVIKTPEGEFEIPAYDVKKVLKRSKRKRFRDAIRSQRNMIK